MCLVVVLVCLGVLVCLVLVVWVDFNCGVRK